MQCRSVLTRVDAHRTGELDAGEVVRLEDHLERCPSCNESLSDVGLLAEAVRTLTVSPPRSCRTKLHDACCDSFDRVEAHGRVAWVAFADEGIRMIDLSGGPEDAFRRRYAGKYAREICEASLPDSARKAVEEALAGHKVKLPDIDFSGFTEFERAVLEKAAEIPLGEVRSYEWIASQIGRPAASRAVGNALANNVVPLLLPCHRVVPASGGVGRYAFGSKMKRSLLETESVPVAELDELDRKGVRFIGSRTTKIFCFPTCRDARRIREENRVPFRDARAAERKGFRPCRHCQPVSVSA